MVESAAGRRAEIRLTDAIKIIADNRRARHDYEVGDRLEAGLMLTGSEIKSVRAGKVQLKDAYAEIRDGEVWLVGVHIAEYPNAGYAQHPVERERKCLLHRAEIDKLIRLVREKGLTLIPMKMYLKRGRAKVEIGLARGRKAYDKRHAIKERESRRDLDQMMKKSRR